MNRRPFLLWAMLAVATTFAGASYAVQPDEMLADDQRSK